MWCLWFIHYKQRKNKKDLKKQETQVMFIETNQIKLVFSMIWLMEILAADKVLCNKTFNVAKNPKYDG